MGEIETAIRTFAIKGTGPSGDPQRIGATADGRVLMAGSAWSTALYPVVGIGTGAAYATGDAFGTGFWVPVPPSGYIDSLTFVDLDNEGLAKTVVLWQAAMTTSADNAAYAPTNADMLISHYQINLATSDFVTYSANQEATVTGINLPFVAPSPSGLWVRLVTRGVDNIAAGAIPLISFGGRY